MGTIGLYGPIPPTSPHPPLTSPHLSTPLPLVETGEKWEKVAKSGEKSGKWLRVGKSGEKLEKVGKSRKIWEKWQKVAKSG